MKEKNFYKKNILCFSRKAALVLILCFLIIMFLFTFSCTSTDNSVLDSNDNDITSNDTTGSAVEEESKSNDGEQTADTDDNSAAGEEDADEIQPVEDEIEDGEITINVYYADNMGEYLIGEARVVSSENKYIDALNELMKIPIDSSLFQLVPDSTKINSVFVEDGLAKVDFSKEFIEDRFQGDTADILLIYSIVNTLTEFPEVNSVSFYIDGEKLDILGEIDIKDPIFRRSDLIK